MIAKYGTLYLLVGNRCSPEGSVCRMWEGVGGHGGVKAVCETGQQVPRHSGACRRAATRFKSCSGVSGKSVTIVRRLNKLTVP